MEPYRFKANTRTDKEQGFAASLEAFTAAAPLSNYEKMQNFPLFTPRQDVARFLAKERLFQMALGVHGAIIECGCLFGGGLAWWAQLSGIHEPTNHVRRCIGFDSFEGFPAVTDEEAKHSAEAHVGGLAVDSYDLITEAARVHDMNRPIGHIPRIELIRGDACETIPAFAAKRPQPVALLYLDFDLLEPTRIALAHLYPLMPKGAIIGFDECHEGWGECQAVTEFMRDHKLRLQRFPWASTISYHVVE